MDVRACTSDSGLELREKVAQMVRRQTPKQEQPCLGQQRVPVRPEALDLPQNARRRRQRAARGARRFEDVQTRKSHNSRRSPNASRRPAGPNANRGREAGRQSATAGTKEDCAKAESRREECGHDRSLKVSAKTECRTIERSRSRSRG
jgi:hypothetical protein